MNEKSIIKNYLDVIIINFNSTDCVFRCIESLTIFKPYDCALNIFVFDNASQDNPERINKLFPEAHIKLNRANVGFGAAINQALTYCHSKYMVFLNPDAWVTDGFIETSIRCMEQNDKIGIMGPLILEEGGGVQGSARAFPTVLTSLFGRNSPITKIFPNNSITRRNILTWRKDHQTPMEVDWVSGACMVVRREAMQVVGGFDKRFFLYWEDTDLCRRMWEAGWKVVYFPEPRVIHSVGKSSNTRPVFANFQFHKSCYRLYEKYAKWPFSVLTPVAGIVLMLRFLAAVIFNYIIKSLNKIQAIQAHSDAIGEQKNGRLRILRIISRMNIGGPSIHVNNLTKHLNPEQFTTRLITGTVSPGEGDMAYITHFKDKEKIVIPQLQREISLFRDLRALIKVIQAIHRFDPHIIHSHTSKAGTISRTAAWLCNLLRSKKIIVVHTFHGNVLDGYFNRFKSTLILWIERSMARVTDAIIAISETQNWELCKVYKLTHPRKISTIKLGFDLIPFKTAGQWRGRVRRRFGIADDTLLIGIVGRMVPIKNHAMFLDAGKTLVDTLSDKKIKFLLVGDGEDRQSLENYTDILGIREKVVFTGWEKDLPQIYADLDILALTSLNEGTPVSVIEAMAASVPVVSTGVGGIKDLLGPFEADQPDAAFKICERGILCPKDDPDTFARALAYMIESGYLLDNGRFLRARDYVLENYSVERLVHDVESLYQKLLATRMLK